MGIARAFGFVATVLTGFAFTAWVALAILTTFGGLEALSNIGVGLEGLEPNRSVPERLDVAPGGADNDGIADDGQDLSENLDEDQDPSTEVGTSTGEQTSPSRGPLWQDDSASVDSKRDSLRADETTGGPDSEDGGDRSESGDLRDGADAKDSGDLRDSGDARDGGDSSDSAESGDGDGSGDTGVEGDSRPSAADDRPAVAGASGPPEDLVPAVDWPELPELEGREPITTTARFRVFADPADDELLNATAIEWAPELDATLYEVSGRMNRELEAETASIVFTRAYEARCPARGLAAPGDDPLVLVFVDEDTGDVQIKAVVAHEIAHLLTFDTGFVGDGVLTEGIANWAAGRHALAWQGVPDWDTAARRYIREGTYTSIADDYGLNPRAEEDCIARRDRVYNARTAFVSWLIDEIGLETVLEMPVREEVRSRGAEDEDEVLRLPDYSAAAGASLTQLERQWLAELMTDRESAESMDDQ